MSDVTLVCPHCGAAIRKPWRKQTLCSVYTRCSLVSRGPTGIVQLRYDPEAPIVETWTESVTTWHCDYCDGDLEEDAHGEPTGLMIDPV